ncbi:MAG: AzlD domain-containing protein [Lachnospiraceae bacterium]|nr:AzlD domain-containing protein [Lachnospiraceae bacterium]
MERALTAVILMALVTYLPRVLPMAVFRKEINSGFIKSFLYYVPYAVLASLTFPDIFTSTTSMVTAIAGTLTALLLAYKEKSLVVVALCSMLTVFITQLIV